MSTDFPAVGFPPDLVITKRRSLTGGATFMDRLRGNNKALISSGAAAEATVTSVGVQFNSDTINGVDINGGSGTRNYTAWCFKRAPGFMDIVCYSGNGITNRTISHNLGAIPQFMIARRRDVGDQWFTYHVTTGSSTFNPLNGDAAASSWSGSSAVWGTTAHTSTTFTVGTDSGINSATGLAYVVYLFATLAGVSKVGSYTGNGGSQTINCGFTTGARFILIKCSSAVGDWRVVDVARGIIPSSDPTLSLNNTNTEVGTDDWVDADNTGFIVNQTSTSNMNVLNSTYIFLAIA